MNNQYVAYLRVSTQKQGFSGLGLEAQREIIQKYLRDKTPVAEYVEIESGRKKDRPKLKEALSLCRKTEATLIVAKLTGWPEMFPSCQIFWRMMWKLYSVISHKPIK